MNINMLHTIVMLALGCLTIGAIPYWPLVMIGVYAMTAYSVLVINKKEKE